jgi:hypothetical protein
LGWSAGSWPLFWSERDLGQLWEPSYSFSSLLRSASELDANRLLS